MRCRVGSPVKVLELGATLPASTSLLWVAVCVQVALIVGPIYFVGSMFWAVPICFLVLSFLLFSVERTLPLLLAVTVALPSTVLSDLVCPVVCVYKRLFSCWPVFRLNRLGLSPPSAHNSHAGRWARPVLSPVTCLSVGIGYLYSNEVKRYMAGRSFPTLLRDIFRCELCR